MVGSDGTGQAAAARARRIMLTGGGTAGHVNPLLAVWEQLALRQPRLRPLWVGSERIESQLVPAAGLRFAHIDIRFSYRRPTPDNWGYYRRHILPLLLGRPFRQALARLDRFQPDVVLASGGYVSAPVVWAAQQRGIPVALLQLDDPPGLVNYHFADRAWRVLCSTPAVAAQFSGRCAPHRLRVVGYPALAAQRTSDEVRAEYGLEPGRRLLVVVGGSLGAGAIHRAVLEFLELTAAQPGEQWAQLAVLHVGGEREALLQRELKSHDFAASAVQYIPLGYLHDPQSVLLAADYYFGRCGAATAGELLAAGLPALLMPDPQHADRQQYGNAQAVLATGQGTLLEERSRGHGTALAQWLHRVWDQRHVPAPAPPAALRAASEIMEVWPQ